MAQALRNRLNGNKEEVLRDTELYGWGYAMDKYGVKDYVAWANFIEDATHNPNFGRNPTFSPNTGEDLGEQIVRAMSQYIIKAGNDVARLRKENEYLKWELRKKGIGNREKVSPLLQACES